MELQPGADGEEADLFEIHRAVFRSHIEQIWGWDEKWQRSNFATELGSSTTSVIRSDAFIVGYLQFRDEGNRIYVQNIALLPDFQRQGLGTRLIKELQAKAAARGVSLDLGVFRTNAPAQRFYERLGFERTCDTETHTMMSWNQSNQTMQNCVCTRFNTEPVPPVPTHKVGIALQTLGFVPLNAMRVIPAKGTCGWYICHFSA